MDIALERIRSIRNTACIICGAGFNTPRAGKLYCSAKCKQFAYYHNEEIKALQDSNKGITNTPITLSMKDYEWYCSIESKSSELEYLKLPTQFDPSNLGTIRKLKKQVPAYARALELRKLTLEEWSFLKIIYANLNPRKFLKVVGSLDIEFFQSLTVWQKESKIQARPNPVSNLYQNHVQKIAEGKVKFV